jgi:hypothetical protein
LQPVVEQQWRHQQHQQRDRSRRGDRPVLVGELAELRAQAGVCATDAPIAPTGALSGEFTWRCAQGRVKGTLLLAPTSPPRIQSLRLARVAP